MSILEKLIEEDFGYIEQGTRWGRSVIHSSLVVDRERDLFFWNSMDLFGDAFIYLTKVRNLPYEDAKGYLKSFEFYKGSFIHEIRDKTEVVVYPKLVDIFHENLMQSDREYFYKRGITDETMHRFKLGFYNEFYMIPIYQDGLFKQFQMRRDNPKMIRNYYKNVGPLLFNSDIMKITDKIVLTEGPTSSIILNQNGIPSVSSNGGATGFQESWYIYFIHQKEILVLYDNDPAGIQGAERVAKILGENRVKVYNFEEFDEKGFDANDYFIQGGTKEGMMDILENRTKHVFEKESFKEKRIFKGKDKRWT